MSQGLRKWCAVSVDLDEIPHYSAIHGLSNLQLNLNAVYSLAVPRLMEWSEQQEIPLTLFTIGRDCEREPVQAALSNAIARGHEIGNHSLDHRYDLTRLDAAEMRRQVGGAQSLFNDVLGVRPVGFRAPGYATNDVLYEVLCDAGFRYSSSVFPCPPYYAAKVGAIWLKRLLGKRSASIIDDPRVLSAPTEPYRVGVPYWRRGQGILEFPIQTTPGLRLPFIGTTINLFGPRRARWLTRQIIGVPFVNLELHGIDLLDRFDHLQALAPYQPDLKVALHQKLAALNATLQVLKEAGYAFTTLAAAAERLHPLASR